MTIRPDSQMTDETSKEAIKMLDLKLQYEDIMPEIKKVLKEILESGRYILGEHVTSFEREVADYHNVKYAVSLASGTDALHLCLRALGIKEGDEVITTPFTFIATAEAIAYVGATPVFADVNRDTQNIEPASIKEKLTSKTRAIIPVHLFGQPADMDEIMEIANSHNLRVIEDAAQAFGAEYKGARVGSLGNAGCFSFYPSKNLGGLGDGGIMITNSQELSEKIRLLRNHGSTGPYKHSFIGYNSRLDEVQAAILRIKLKRIDLYNNARRDLAGIYTSILGAPKSGIKCPQEIPGCKHVYHQYTIRTAQRSVIQNILKDKLIPSVVYYPVPLHLQGAFSNLGYKEKDLPVSESLSREVLSLPMYPELEQGKVEFIAGAVADAVKR
jgi:dTDP-4-amino-4,6-dideoxygalactose transaminase